MVDFIVNHGATILISGLLLALVLWISVSMFKKRKRGKPVGCNCGCGSCPGASFCHPGEEDFRRPDVQ